MTWTVNLFGHDDLSGDEKVAFEEGLVQKTRELVETLKEQDLSDTFHLWEVYDERQQWRIEDRWGIHPLIPDSLGAGSGSRPDSPVAPDGPNTLGGSAS